MAEVHMAELDKDYIVKSSLPDIPFPECDIWTSLEIQFQEHASMIALDDPKEGKKLTFQETYELAEKMAANLLKSGYNPEIPICIYMSNCIEIVLILLAVWRLGGIASTINPLLVPDEARNQLNTIEAEFLFCNESTVEKGVQAGTGTAKIFSTGTFSGCISLSTLLYGIKSTEALPRLTIDPKLRTALILFSSGTTGIPKAVEITHSAINEHISYFIYTLQIQKHKNGGISFRPMSHNYGITLILMYLKTGQTLIVMEDFDLEEYISLVVRYQVEILYIVPPIAVQLCKNDVARKYDISRVKTIVSGASPLSEDQEKDLLQLFTPGTKLIQCYGMTEVVSVAINIPTFATSVKCPYGSVGWPTCKTWAKVTDINTKENLSPMKPGEILLKCNYMMKGYHGNDEATKNSFDKDGWLYTGDVGYYDENCCFFIIDRIKELIKYQGFQVSPSELESVLLTNLKVADVGVTSVPDLEAGELPLAWVVLKNGESSIEQELIDFVKERVASYKWLRGGVKFVDNIPKTSSGKILRRTMKEQVKQELCM